MNDLEPNADNGLPKNEATNLDEIDEIFRAESAAILAEMTAVLRNHNVEGYSVHSFSIGEPPRPNPEICIPSLHRVHDHVYELKCTYVEIF